MFGPTGHGLIYRSMKNVVKSPQNVSQVVFPQKTTVTSAQMVDHLGRPTYRKDMYV